MRALRTLLLLLPLYGLWLLLEQRFTFPELLVGVGVVVFAAGVDAAVRRGAAAELDLSPRLLLPALTLPARYLADSARLYAALARSLAAGRRLHGAYRWLPFAAGQPDDSGDATRRALATWYGSFTPSSYVVGFDAERGAMVVHELPAGGPTPAGSALGERS